MHGQQSAFRLYKPMATLKPTSKKIPFFSFLFQIQLKSQSSYMPFHCVLASADGADGWRDLESW